MTDDFRFIGFDRRNGRLRSWSRQSCHRRFVIDAKLGGIHSQQNSGKTAERNKAPPQLQPMQHSRLIVLRLPDFPQYVPCKKRGNGGFPRLSKQLPEIVLFVGSLHIQYMKHRNRNKVASFFAKKMLRRVVKPLWPPKSPQAGGCASGGASCATPSPRSAGCARG